MKKIEVDLVQEPTVDLTSAPRFLRRLHRYPRNGEWRARRPGWWSRLKSFFQRKEST